MMTDGTEVPAGLRYTAQHEWIRVEDGMAVVGVTNHAQKEMHEVVFVELPKPGKQVKQGEVLCIIETMKAISEVYAPVGGTVAEANTALTTKPELVNTAPYGHGWLAKLKPAGSLKEELARLMDAAAYKTFIEKK